MNAHLPRCPVCWTHHVPDCVAIEAIAESDTSSVTFVSGTDETEHHRPPPPGFVTWDEALAWTMEQMSHRVIVDTLEAMWALPAKEA